MSNRESERQQRIKLIRELLAVAKAVHKQDVNTLRQIVKY